MKTFASEKLHRQCETVKFNGTSTIATGQHLTPAQHSKTFNAQCDQFAKQQDNNGAMSFSRHESAIAWSISIAALLVVSHGILPPNKEFEPLEKTTHDADKQKVHNANDIIPNTRDVENTQHQIALNDHRFNFNRIVELTKPKTLAQSSSPFNVYTSIWTTWSHWSLCYKNQQMRVRACSAIRGHHCPGENIQSKSCRKPIGLFQVSKNVVTLTRPNVNHMGATNALKENASHRLSHTVEQRQLTTTVMRKGMEDKLTTIAAVIKPPARGFRRLDAVESQALPPSATIGPPSAIPPNWPTSQGTLPPSITPPNIKQFEKIAEPPTLDRTTIASPTQTTLGSHDSLVLVQPEMSAVPKTKQPQIENITQVVPQSSESFATVEKNHSVPKRKKFFPEVKLTQMAHSTQGDNDLRVHQASWSSWSVWSSCMCKRRSRTRTCNYPVDAPLITGCPGESYEIIICEGSENPELEKNCIKRAKMN
ncbi:hypothetical protein TTRE_0000232501 [Trichuris trichiura]|uniref:Uncharacterized protein n=1 Tax=Trichuris trichiura TaxID=36087 RepID=A0A077Z1T3_TRITR|nr:hypothetical protein TTRE_0000232501 [Trichuris trichiura]